MRVATVFAWLVFVSMAALLRASPAAEWSALRTEAATLGKPNWRPMLGYLARLHEQDTHPAEEPFAYDWEEIGRGYGYGPAFGHWDTVQSIIDVLPDCPEHARHQLLNDLQLQLPSGFLPGLVYLKGSPGGPGDVAPAKSHASFDRGIHGHPPLWVLAANDYLTLHPDVRLLRECYDRAARQIGWFVVERCAVPEGFFYNDILVRKWESGVDEGVRFDAAPHERSACVDATSHVYLLYAIEAQWARKLGENPGPWDAKARRLAEFIRSQLWSDMRGFFFDRWAIEQPGLQTASFEGMWPVVVGAASPEQARRVIDEWLTDRTRFFTPHPIATVAASDSKFSLRMWRGPAWNSMTYWAARGCLGYGRRDAARALLEAALDDSAKQFDRTGTLWEFYHPFGGHPEDLTRKPQTKRNQPWTDYVGHNPLFAMARMWRDCGGAAAR